jgi:hypothetical protein
MAFATKYRIKTVSNVYGGVQCDLQKDGYSGSVIELEGRAPDPIQIKIGRNGQNIFEPILQGEVDISFYATGSQNTLELATDLPFTWKVVITQQTSADPIWQGWVQPESYQEAYHSTPYSVGLRATDGLDDLKAIPFVAGSTDDTLWEYLLTALGNTNITLPFKESINIYDTAMTSATSDSPLVQAKALPSSFLVISDEPSCYDVIAEILIPFGARIYQYEGHWRIENIQGKRSSYVERTYTSAGVYSSQATINPLKILSNATPDFRQFISKSGQLQTIPAVNQARVFFETTSGEPSDAIPGFSTDADWTDSSTLANWTKTSGFTITKQAVNYKGNNFGVKINGRQTTLSNRYIESPAFSVAAATFGSLNLSFSFLMDWPSLVVFGSKPNFYVEIILEAAVNTYYWKNEWVQAIQRNPLQTANRNVWEDWSTAIASVPEDGDIKIRLYQSVKNGSEGVTQVTVTNWKFEAEQDVEISAKYRMESGVLNFLAGLNPVDREVYFSDGDTVTRPGVLSVGSTLTTSWSRRGLTDNIPLLRLFLLQFLSLHQRPAIKLQGQLHQRGEQILPYHTVQDNASVSTRKYVMVSYVMGLTTGVGRVSYRELLETDASPTYLSELFSQLPFDFNFTSPSQQPFGPAIPSLPDFNFNLNGDVFGQPGTTTLSKSAIVDKPALDLTAAPESSTILLNAVSNVIDSTPMTNITALSLITEWPDKATPIAADKIPILDSVTGEIRMAAANSLPIAGSKWTEVTNGIYRNGRVAIGQTTVSTDWQLEVNGNTNIKSTARNGFSVLRTFTSADLTLFAAARLSATRSGGLLNGQGPAFYFAADGSDNDRLGVFGAIKRGTHTGDIVFQTNNGSVTTRHQLTVKSAGGVYIGDETVPFNASTEASSLEVKNRIKTGNVGASTARFVKMGDVTTATVTPDRLWRIEINGVEYDVPLKIV